MRFRVEPDPESAPDADAPDPVVPPDVAPLPASRRREAAVLQASRSIIELYLERGTTELPVKELAAHVGLAERTFYRYFPRKEETIRPYVEHGLERIVAKLRATPTDRSLESAVIEAHAESFEAGKDARWQAFFPLLQADEKIRGVWLQVVAEAETSFAAVIAERLGLQPEDQRARLAGAVLTLLGRLALEQPFGPGPKRDPGQVFAECMALLGPLFRNEPQAS